ncbi:hypothetical protein C8F01DRAFT_1373452 [Mycena amicta]|nr:hypothetical protein C8F01DRAFT_1373452 [Mycena amicta]
MPVSFPVATHRAKAYPFPHGRAGYTAEETLAASCKDQYTRAGEILQFSLSGDIDGSGRNFKAKLPDVVPNQNGFVATLLDAYTQDRALVIRPDDVWIAILSQFNFFVTARAELLRANFVAHEGKEDLTIVDDDIRGSRYTVDFGYLARQMAGLIEKNVVDPGLRAWAIPSFTTTTPNDITVGAVLLMATLKNYFNYKMLAGGCGIPRVTLEGERTDWVDTLGRLEKLKEYGIETIAWYHLLRPVISRFVAAFDAPGSAENVDFWQRVTHYVPGGSGRGDYHTGWISAFTVFSKEGRWMGDALDTTAPSATAPEKLTAAEFWRTYGYPDELEYDERLVLDGTTYPVLRPGAIPPGYGEVDVLLIDRSDDKRFQCAMVAGSVGTRVLSSGDRALSEGGRDDTVQPVTGWWLFIKDEAKLKRTEREKKAEYEGSRYGYHIPYRSDFTKVEDHPSSAASRSPPFSSISLEVIPPDPARAGYTAEETLAASCKDQHTGAGEILQFSLSSDIDGSGRNLQEKHPNLVPNQNGFVATLLDAYTQDRAVVIRPDDVWLAILSQFNFFVTARAELLRANFVSHEGKKDLTIVAAPATRYTVDFGHLAQQMAGLIEKNVVDPGLRAWATPGFTTTTPNDITVGAVLLMATLKNYFNYIIVLFGCGIPRVTLEGERADWVDILGRLEKLKEYGVETIAWYHLLRPVISRFVAAFDAPASAENVDFWQRVAHYVPGGSGRGDYHTGWISAFTTFSKKGEWMGNALNTTATSATAPETLTAAEFWRTYGGSDRLQDNERLVLDGTPYPVLYPGAIPPGYCEVDVLLIDNGERFDCAMVAGSVGTRVLSSGDRALSAHGEDDTVQPVTGWWLFVKDEEKLKKREMEKKAAFAKSPGSFYQV